MTLAVTVADAENDEAEWNDYVARTSGATMFHLFGWQRIIKRVYGYNACYLIARRDGGMVGVLPLIDVASPLMGRNLISTAFTVGGGIVADDDEACQALAEAALEEGRRRRVKYIELRSRSALIDGWTVKDGVYATFEMEFPTGAENKMKAIPRRRRAEVRKGLAAVDAGKLRYTFDDEQEAFYDLYAHAMRDHGTPIFPRRFVTELMKEFSDFTEILVIRADDEPVLALLTFHFHERVMPYYFGAHADARKHRAYDLAIWLQMRRGAERGAHIFDFGRSKYGTGSFDYKAFWGFEPIPTPIPICVGQRDVKRRT